jgi:ubiquinone/menaquinone biosynthesis C-methylase UbiE
MQSIMKNWKTWESKNDKYVTWYKKKPSEAFLILWDLLQKKFMELVPPKSNQEDILLDVGCGDGRYLFSSIKSKGYIGIGIDPNKQVSLLPAKKRIKKAGLNALLIKSVGECIPLKESSVSVALCNSALDHTLEPMVVLNEIHRTLRENGILILWQGIYEPENSGHETHLRVFTKDSLTNMLRIAGFSITKSSFLGFSLVSSSESYESVSSRVPQFLDKFLPIILEIYLLIGNLLPKYASIAMFRAGKLKRKKLSHLENNNES